MAHQGKPKQDTSAPIKGGGGQTVVEMCEVTSSGLMFWSRQRFQIGSELQMRMRRTALPIQAQAKLPCQEEWVMMRGFVVQCTQVRRKDGTIHFQVAMVFEAALATVRQSRPASSGRVFHGGLIFGPN